MIKKNLSLLFVVFFIIGTISTSSVSATQFNEYRVLVLKDVDAWNAPVVVDTLNTLGIPYDVMTSKELFQITAKQLIRKYAMIIIVSDQDQEFYDNIAKQVNKLEEYVAAGRVLQIHAAGHGWNRGIWKTLLPGGTEFVFNGEYYDYIIQDNTYLYSTYASHGYLIMHLPINVEVITVQAPNHVPDYNKPSTITYPFVRGKILVTTLTIEFSIPRQGEVWRNFFYNVLKDNYNTAITLAKKYSNPLRFTRIGAGYLSQYMEGIREYQTLYEKALSIGVDKNTLSLVQQLYIKAGQHFNNTSQPNASTFQVLAELRQAAYYQTQAVEILKDAISTGTPT